MQNIRKITDRSGESHRKQLNDSEHWHAMEISSPMYHNSR